MSDARAKGWVPGGCYFTRRRTGPHQWSRPPPSALTPVKGERAAAQKVRAWHRRAPGRILAVRRSTSRIQPRRRIGNSPLPTAFSHGLGLAPVNMSHHAIKEGHSRPAGREVPFEFEIPVEAIPFRKPDGKACLLFRGKLLNRVLNLGEPHIGILTRRCHGLAGPLHAAPGEPDRRSINRRTARLGRDRNGTTGAAHTRTPSART